MIKILLKNHKDSLFFKRHFILIETLKLNSKIAGYSILIDLLRMYLLNFIVIVIDFDPF